MYHRSRSLHRWFGICCALFLTLMATTGLFLAIKGRVGWMRPPVADAMPLSSPSEIISLDQVLKIAFATGHSEMDAFDEVDRVDYRPKDNVFKVVSKEGYREVQVCGKSGKILGDAFRNDQLMEDLHDMSFFTDAAHNYLLPVVAVGLLTLALTGIGIFFTPYVRRWKYRHRSKQ